MKGIKIIQGTLLLLFNLILVCPNFLYAQDEKYIQIKINQAVNLRNKIVSLKKGKTYIIEKPINVYSGILIEGNNSVLKPSKNWNEKNERYSSLINIINTKNVVIRDFTIDIEGQTRGKKSIFCSILLLGANKTLIENIVFRNSGAKYYNDYAPNSPHILILSQGERSEFNYLTRAHSQLILNSTNNIIKNCKFINDKSFSSFAIRVLSSWQVISKKIVQCSGNIIYNNYFEGGFEWNTIEVAGPNTINNRIENNIIKGKSINNIDIDKGASDNSIVNNQISEGGLPERYKDNGDVLCSPIAIHGNSKALTAKNNKVIGNKIDNIANPNVKNARFTYSAGILALNVDNVEIKNNEIKNLFGSNHYGGGIVLDQYCKDVVVTDNTISNTYWGIVFTPNGRYMDGLTIAGNRIDSKHYGVFLAFTSGGKYKNVKVESNKVNILSKNDLYGIFIGKAEDGIMNRYNIISGGFNKKKPVFIKIN